MPTVIPRPAAEFLHDDADPLTATQSTPTAAANAPTKIGATVPSGIPLQPIPVEVSAKIPQLKTHSFLVKDDKVIIVDPKDNRISTVIE